MASSYPYDISSFPNGVVAPDRLQAEIAASAITVAFDHVSSTGDTTTLVFKAALPTADKSLLDTIVGGHSGAPLPTSVQPVMLAMPTTSDGKPIFQPSMFPGGVYLYITGAGDDGTRGNGQPFAVQSDAAGDTSIEFHFNDWVYVSSGGLTYAGAEFGDSVTFEFYAPASPVTPNGAHTGNCNLVDPGVGAPILVIPANGNGAYNVDLANAVPVPAFGADGSATGFWDWSEPDTGRGTLQAGTPTKSPWHLFAVVIPLVRFVNRMPILGSASFDMNPPPIKSKKMLPHWKGKVILHNAGHTGLKAAWWLATARAATT